MITRVNINTYEKALVFNKGVYVKLLSEGSYWTGFNDVVLKYNIMQDFIPPIELNILLQDENFVNATTLIEVNENEIALKFKDGILAAVLTTGRYIFWKSAINYEFNIINISEVEIDSTIDKAILTNKLLINYVRNFTIESNEKAVLFVDGKFNRVIESGTYTFWRNSIPVVVNKADVRVQQIEISGQEILTKDKVNIRMNAFASYQIADIEKALVANKEFDKQLYVAFQLALREYVGSLNFDDLMEKKESIKLYVLDAVQNKATQLGVNVDGFGVRDIILPGDVKDIMNQVLIAEKKAQANTIMRREETASTRSLLNTAKLMDDNPMLYKLKEMEFVEKIADNINSITVNGNGALFDQLKQILVPPK